MEKYGNIEAGRTPPETTTTPSPACEKRAADALDTDVVKRAAEGVEQRARPGTWPPFLFTDPFPGPK